VLSHLRVMELLKGLEGVLRRRHCVTSTLINHVRICNFYTVCILSTVFIVLAWELVTRCHDFLKCTISQFLLVWIKICTVSHFRVSYWPRCLLPICNRPTLSRQPLQHLPRCSTVTLNLHRTRFSETSVLTYDPAHCLRPGNMASDSYSFCGSVL
jgi:hypothetical protein